MPQPSPRSVLEVLTKSRLAVLGRELGVSIPASGSKEAQIDALAASPNLDLAGLLRSLGRDELRAKLLALMMTPATMLVRVLAAPAQGFAQVLDARRRSLEGEA